ncbi:nucleotidyltransferase domain-containing protein [Candidatus Roizmanbacteria bacterium CG07_land_8_20_14_0_80_34_15]|uniref:Nucleotidyltransferase domain-containing protein n=1 Tax=Candidatus Roizmanbacteria bacterium CG07_land_8_20_14_0_80_34_15 TaxID=1974849 RepID=A0A2M6YTQ5_9BACT|nr:MAG: nucleotidyltransferase domain-containing protein [Candidatus Roizmanbacteria bacterium CG07_land_8_20_14_0_80_34_15]
MTDQELVFEQLKRMKPQAIILFGSYAWGKPHIDSDLDILMIKNTKKTFRERVRDSRFQLKTHVPVDLIILTPEEVKKYYNKRIFLRQIVEEGKLIYGRI